MTDPLPDVIDESLPVEERQPLVRRDKDAVTYHPEGVPMTPAQARVDAVAALTTSSLAKAGTLQLAPEETERLTAPFADSDFLPGAAGKENLIYIQHSALRDRLSKVLGLGHWALIVRESWNEDFKTAKGVAGIRVYVRAMMIVRGCYVGEAVGDMDYYPSNGQQNFGDAFEGGKTAAFRRCAKDFGIGTQAWDKHWCEGWWARKKSPQKPPATTQSTPRALTPEERREKLLSSIVGFLPEATQVFRSESLIGPEDMPADITPETVNKFSPDSLLALVKQIKALRSQTDQLESAEVPDGRPPHDTGIVEATTEKPGIGSNGKAYIKYGVKIGGNWHNHFSKSLHEKATGLKGTPVVFACTTNQYGSTIESIEAQKGVDY